MIDQAAATNFNERFRPIVGQGCHALSQAGGEDYRRLGNLRL